MMMMMCDVICDDDDDDDAIECVYIAVRLDNCQP